MHSKIPLILVISLLILCTKNGFSQICFPVKKIYAFFEPVKKGVINKDDAKKQQTGGNYLVYVESRNSNIILHNIWINGVIYNGRLQEVSTPVLSAPDGNIKPLTTAKPSSVMVPSTKRKVYQVIFTALDSGQKEQVMPARYASKPLLMDLGYKKKRKYFTVNEIIETKPANMM
ncbi:MAG: hypothetical protein WKF97_09820 [Chitinophagaceae bacterium]